MKKLLLSSALVSLVVLSACGDGNEETTTDPVEETSADSTDSTETSDESTEDTDETEEDTQEENDSATNDTTLDTGEFVYEIKEIEQLDSQYDASTQILAVELTFTNNSEDAISPWISQGITAEQETDTTVETLMGSNGLYPEDYKTELVEMGDTNVKPGATVDAVIGFEILYPGEPVTLKEFTFNGDSSFEHVVETTE
ncbi:MULTISPECIES: DUF5067 domain-containing protein [Shouchella]|uniref:DUF5067 domain-containing protein n=2 Tax=Bacillaceae TaxID=186817 RepID=A0A060LV51_9BACI|nr:MULTISPECIES: DUF5067 domain-containing protein [Bacillaceae]AIC93665.1 hypothetical protein BleG1_1062 [Shouchella lehensis G1]KQL56448.1 hypothetical protein AN965_14115 [Alkalicoccobacillus plakortidis]RQW21898.1 DUF5067 domain-containing protein [Bacillus sp. C1-1]